MRVYNFCAILIIFNYVACDSEIIEKTLNLLKDADDKIQVKNDDEIILVFGTGSKKHSGLIKFITQHYAESDYTELTDNRFSVIDKSVELKTPYPKLYYAEQEGTAFYDCTRFVDISDPNDAEFPIVSSFYLRKVIESATKIKLIFLMDYSKIDQKNTDNAKLLLQQVKHLFNDITQYVNNMGLILITADSEDPSSSWKTSLSQNVNNFDPSLMTIYNALFNQIPTFNAQLEASLSELRTTKPGIIDFIKRLQFRNKNINDLKELSINSKNLLLQIVDHINTLRSSTIVEVSAFLKTHFQEEERNMDNVKDFIDLINSNLNKLEKMIDSYYEHLNDKIFVNEISEYLEELNIVVPNMLKDESLKYNKLLNFLSAFDTEGKIRTSSMQWVTELEAAEAFFDRLNCLYVFFNEFSDKLDETAIIDDTQLVKGPETLKMREYFSDLKRTNGGKRTKKERFTDENSEFYTKIMKMGNSELKYINSHLYYRILNRSINNFQYTKFLGIYDNAFKSYKIDCSHEKKIKITGYNIHLSNIDLNDEDFEECTDKDVVEIFARSKVYFDLPLSYFFQHHIKYVFIIAPTWEKRSKVFSYTSEAQGPVIGIGSNFYNVRKTLWNLERDKQYLRRLEHVSHLKIIDLNGKIKIDDFATTKTDHPDLGDYINDYKKDLLQNLNDPISKRKFNQFLSTLSENADVNKLYNTATFYNNLNLLEESYYDKKGKIICGPLYETLFRTVQLYKESNPDISDELKEVLKRLYAAVLSRVINLTTYQHTSLVLDHEKYLSFAMDNANELKNGRTIYLVGEKNREYNAKINKKIEEGAQYIEKEFKPETEKLNNEISNSLRLNLIKEIRDLENKAEQDKKDLTNMIIGQSIGSLLGVVGTGLSFLGPIGKGIGTVMSTAGSIVTSTTSGTLPTVREDLKPKIESMQNFINAQQQNQKDSIECQVKVMEDSKDPSFLSTISTTLEFLNEADITKYEKAGAFLVEKLDELEKQTNLASSVLNVINKVKSVAQIANVSSEIFSTFKDDLGKISSMSSLLVKKNEEINNLVNLRDSVSNSFVPLLHNMAQDLTRQMDNMAGKSHISLYVKQYKIKQTLSDIQKIITDATTGFQVQAEVLEYMGKLMRAVEITITIYDQIQNYEEQKEFADYIADIRVAGMRDPLIGEHKEMADKLTVFLQSSIVLDNYLVAANSLKQFLFPFAHFYSEHLFFSDTIEKKLNIIDLAVLVSDKTTELFKKMKEYTSTHSNDRSLDLMIYYDIPNTFAKPFYTWKDEKYRELISSLLKGDEITLETEISSDTRNALKFSEIEFSIKSHNSEVQKILNDTLNYYVVDLVHLGNSYYKCNRKVYVISGASASLRHSFYKDSDKKLIYQSRLHEQLSANKFILSPYATWQVKLTDETRRNDFSKLAALDASKIYLELSGKGQYVPDDVKCDYHLDKYYKLDSVLKSNA